jgi:nucleoside-diphosphate-sugar epimerase
LSNDDKVKYFVTGATGFIGGRVAKQLVAAGHAVTIVARDPDKAKDLAALGVAVRPGDVTDKQTLREPMTGADGVFHIAGWYKIGTRDKSQAAAINIAGTRNVLETMKELNIAKGVYTSTLAVNGDTHGVMVDETFRAGGPWLSEYDRTKWVAHYEVAEPMMRAGLPLVVVMPGLTYGPGDPSAAGATLEQYLSRRLPLAPSGTAFCWAHVDDIARAHILAMDKGRAGESYIVAGPKHTLIDALAMAQRFTGIPAPRMHPGPAMMRAMAAIMSAVGAIVPLPELYSREALRVSAGVTYIGSNAKARRELGYDPRPLEAGLPETLAFDMKRLGIQPPAGSRQTR